MHVRHRMWRGRHLMIVIVHLRRRWWWRRRRGSRIHSVVSRIGVRQRKIMRGLAKIDIDSSAYLMTIGVFPVGFGLFNTGLVHLAGRAFRRGASLPIPLLADTTVQIDTIVEHLLGDLQFDPYRRMQLLCAALGQLRNIIDLVLGDLDFESLTLEWLATFHMNNLIFRYNNFEGFYRGRRNVYCSLIFVFVFFTVLVFVFLFLLLVLPVFVFVFVLVFILLFAFVVVVVKAFVGLVL